VSSDDYNDSFHGPQGRLPENDVQRRAQEDRARLDKVRQDAERWSPAEPPTFLPRGGYSPGPVAGGGGDASGCLPVVVFVFGAAGFVLLYPFSVVIGGTAALIPPLILRAWNPAWESWQMALAVIAAMILGWRTLRATNRREHELARLSRAYRWFRHIVRLTLIGAVALAAVFVTDPAAQALPLWQLIFSHADQFLRDWAIIGGVMLATHLVLLYARHSRTEWHSTLEDWHFRMLPPENRLRRLPSGRWVRVSTLEEKK
jgi:hypothetical protein